MSAVWASHHMHLRVRGCLSMRVLKDKVLVARTTIIAMAICGIVAGYFLGRALALQLAENWLDQNAKIAVDQGDAAFTEARDLLAGLKHSPYSFCSDAEMAHFRELVFRSKYLKDVGRIHNGKIDCSATADHSTLALGKFKPASVQQDGTIAYSNLVPIRDAKLKRFGLQLGTAYVVLGPLPPASKGPFPLQLNFKESDATGDQPGGLADGPPEISKLDMTTDGVGREGQLLYATQCSMLHSTTCVTASATAPDALRGEVGTITICTLLWGLLGAVIGIGFSIILNRRCELYQQFHRAVSSDKVEVVYQPIVALSTGRIVGAEALARWKDDDDNPISPDVFIKIAEDHGFIQEVTKKVLGRALSALAETLRENHDFRLSLNISGADIADPGFLPMLDNSLRRVNVQTESLVVEITERVAAENATAMETIRELRRRGYSIHIDDFGTGYSNLDRLLYLYADTIKIDKAFTRVIGTEAVTVAIIPQILAMAKSLGLEVIVEGIETERQANYFTLGEQKLFAQGFLYGRPVNEESFIHLLARNWSEPVRLIDLSPLQAPRTFEQPSPYIV